MSAKPYECWTLEELDALDSDEILEGYLDGFGGAPEPGGNRAPAYHHGWLTGASDKGRIPSRPWMRTLAHLVVLRNKQRAA